MYQVVALNTVSEFLKRGISPSYDEDGVLVINQRCIRDGRISLVGARRNNPQRRGVPDDRWLRKWDVVVNSTGVGTLGRVAQLTEIPSESVTVDSHVTIVRPDLDHVDGRYFGYALRKNQPQIEAMGEGATGQTELSRHRLGDEILIGLPPLPVQRKIAAVLAAYDELIENNLRRIEILEKMAQAVYREWFVNFRFPGHEEVGLVDSPLGPIPEGWEAATVSDAIELNPRLRLPRDQEIRFVPMGCLMEDSMVIDGHEIRIGPSGSQFRNGDTLLARITPSLENGKTGFVQFLSENEIACGSTEFIVMRSRTLTPEFVYLLARTEDFRGVAIKSMVGASGRQRVQESSISRYVFAHPDGSTLQSFSEMTAPMFRLVQNLVDQNANLRATRDLLLPKLVSGKIDVSDLDIDTEWLAS
jgi:type I restriction enzyme S subunit